MENKNESIDTELFRSIFENATVGIFIVDVKTAFITKVNTYGYKLFGYEEGELEGQKIEVLVPKKYEHSHAKYHGEFMEEPVHRPMGENLDLHGVKKDGTHFSVEISLAPVKISGQTAAVAFVSNIENRLKAEKSSKENEARLSAVIDSAVDCIITINNRGVIQTANSAIKRLFQYEPQEIIGKNITILMPEPRKSEHDDYLDNYHHSGKRKIIGIGREVLGQKKDGTKFDLYLSVSEAVIENETIYTGILHDLSDRKNAEKAEIERSNWLESYAENLESEVAQRTAELRKSELKLRDALKKERELNDLKSRFVSMASHEFRTPLSTVLSSTELIEMYLDINNRDKIDKNIGRIKKSVDHLNGILNDFLSLEKVETGKLEYKPQELSFKKFVVEVLEEIEMSTKSKHQIKTNYSGSENLNTDPFLMKNILFNLLSNAIKYSPDDKTILLEVDNNQSEKLTVKVKDQGIGIPVEDQKNMFSRFFRASNVENIKGTGLGLTIVKKYAELMNGEIIFESKEGEGTEFMITFKK